MAAAWDGERRSKGQLSMMCPGLLQTPQLQWGQTMSVCPQLQQKSHQTVRQRQVGWPGADM